MVLLECNLRNMELVKALYPEVIFILVGKELPCLKYEKEYNPFYERDSILAPSKQLLWACLGLLYKEYHNCNLHRAIQRTSQVQIFVALDTLALNELQVYTKDNLFDF